MPLLLDSSWNELSVSPAQDPELIIANASLTGGVGTEVGIHRISSNYSYPTSAQSLRIVGSRILSNAGGPLIPLAFFSNPLATQSVSSGSLPNIVEIDFNIAPNPASVTVGSFRVVGIATGLQTGAVALITTTTYRLTLTAPLVADTYFIILNGTTAAPITSGGVALDGKALSLPTGSGAAGGDFVVNFDVIGGVVPGPTAPAILPNSLLWGQSYLSLTAPPICLSLHSDNQLEVANAAQWNFEHQTLNPSNQLPPPLQSWMYLRAGIQWQMNIPLDLGSETFADLQLSFIMNAATHGTWRERVPVIAFQNTYSGLVTLSVTLKACGFFVMGIRGVNSSGVWSMYEMKWLAIY